jgi:RNA polymerase sigma-70 factor, ECF subfamily
MPMFDKGKRIELVWYAIHGNKEALRHLDAQETGLVQLIPQVLKYDKKALSSVDAMEIGLIEHTLKGDKDAFRALYTMNYKPLYAFIMSKIHNKDKAEDVMTETFIRAVDGLKEGHYRRKEGVLFGSYLAGIVRNILREGWREAKKARKLEEGLIRDTLTRNESEVIEVLINTENIDELWKMVGELNQDEQMVIALRYAYDLSYDEIAPVLDRSSRACKQLHYRALRKLKAKFWKRGK